MLNYIHVKNFKSILDLKLDLKALTVFTGLNSSGKSSVIQSIRMLMNQNFKSKPYIYGAGGFIESISRLSRGGEGIELKINFNEDEYYLTLSKDSSDSDFSNVPVMFEYISAERLGPRSTLPILDNSKITIGEKGEYSADYFLRLEDSEIHEKLAYKGIASKLLKHQLNAWMSEISPGVNLKFDSNPKHDNSHIEIDGFRAANTGFGISYALPIVLSILSLTANKNDIATDKTVIDWFEDKDEKPIILIVENPEAHLHPRGQSKLGELVGLAASCGIQIMVETHSDHFIDGLRLAIKDNEFLNKNDYITYFLNKNDSGETEYEAITFNSDGSLSQWPEGFFDQMGINLRRLST